MFKIIFFNSMLNTFGIIEGLMIESKEDLIEIFALYSGPDVYWYVTD